MLVHNCRKPLKKLRDADVCGDNGKKWLYKPSGLWVGVDGDWIRWCSSEEPDWIHPYFYEIDANSLNLLWLKSEEDVLRFSKEYLPEMPGGYLGLTQCIEWGKVGDKYDGIVIAPYQWKLRLDLHKSSSQGSPRLQAGEELRADRLYNTVCN